MKKKNLKSLQLNKKAISNFQNLTGGYEETFITTCNPESVGDCQETATCDGFCNRNTYDDFTCFRYTRNELICP
ncbi:MAG: hypothetical protein AAF611_12860 [Bacteroidota bacterium]